MEQEQQSTADVTPKSAGIRYGLIAAVISVAFFLTLSVADVDMNGPVKYVGWLVSALLIFLAHKYYKDNGTGFMEYGQGIGIAFWLGLISASISSVFTYIYIKFVDTGFIDAIKDQQIEGFQKSGMSEDQIDKAMEISAMFMTPEAMFIMGLIIGILSSVIIGLIVTIFTQKKSPDTSFN